MVTADKIIELLKLKPHPTEGGFFAETYRSDENIPISGLPERYDGERPVGTAIYYLLTPGTYSAMHRLKSDEIFHFYLGDPCTMLQLYPDGESKILTIGNNIALDQMPQVVAPRGVWQGTRLNDGGKFALLGTTVTPGFEFSDFELGKRSELQTLYPSVEGLIESLTNE